jgi:electron transport complex protein RnfG
MKTESTAKYVARLALILFLITAVVALALAFVNKVTAPIIADLNAEKTQKAIEAVLPGGGESIDFTDDTGLVSVVYKGESGYAIQVAPVGFDGAITMMVGVDFEGNVLGISVIDQSETAGLGAVCAAKTSAGEAFRGQFEGVSGTVAVSKDGGELDAITGATITSRAVCRGVNAALACAANLG